MSKPPRTEPLAFEELEKLRDELSFEAGQAQAAMGYYGNGGEVPRDRVERARRDCLIYFNRRNGS